VTPSNLQQNVGSVAFSPRRSATFKELRESARMACANVMLHFELSLYRNYSAGLTLPLTRQRISLMSELKRPKRIVAQFDPTEIGYRLKPVIDRGQVSALTNRLSMLVKNREERLWVLRIEWELLRRPPKIERRTLGTLEKWCSPDTSGDPERFAIARALRRVALDDLRNRAVPTVPNTQKPKPRSSTSLLPAQKGFPAKRKKSGWRWMISAGLPDTNRRRH
jgi:hypothetical protein